MLEQLPFPLVWSITLVIGGIYFLNTFIKWWLWGDYDLEAFMKLPGPKPYPIIGNTLDLNVPPKDYSDAVSQLNKKYGPVYRLFFGQYPHVMISKPDHFQQIMGNIVHNDKGEQYKVLYPFIGKGLISAPAGDLWQHRRKQLTPAFHFKILENFLVIMNEHSEKLIEKISSMAQLQEELDILPLLTNSALDMICECAMGKSVGALDHAEESTYAKALERNLDVLFKFAFIPFFWNPILVRLAPEYSKQKEYLKTLHDFTDKIIREKKAERKLKKSTASADESDLSADDVLLGKKKRLAFLDLLLEIGEGDPTLSETTLRWEVDTFMFAGHDTTTSAMSFTIYALARHPDIQEKVQEEIDSILADDEPITMNDVAQMKYLEICIKEATRIYTTVPFISRKLSENIKIDGQFIPKGTNVMLCMELLHRNPESFPDPLKFDPERFRSQNKMHPYAYVPFSAGGRNCIGQRFALLEVKTVVAKLLKRFHISTNYEPEQLEITPQLVLKPKKGMKLKFTERCLN